MADHDPRRRLAILSAPGSRGDVNPMLALGSELRRRGVDVAIMLAQPYVGLAHRLGLRPVSLVSIERFESLVHDQRLWQTIGGPRALLRDLIPETLEAHYRSIESLLRPGRTVLVAHPLDLASRIFRDVHPDVPLVSVHLAPVLLRTPRDPPRMTGWRLEPRRPAAAVRLAYWAADRLLVDAWLTPPLNRFRATLGLPPVDRPLDRWWLSPDRALGLYPPWFAPRESSWPSVFRAVGFPLYDGPEADGPNANGSEADTRQGQSVRGDPLAEVLAGLAEPPIVFTPGTANCRASDFFQAAVESCRRLGRSGVMLTSRPEQVPADRPESVRVATYLPLGALLPRSAAVVHHGGIGTTSQSLAAGVQQLICPMAFDQFDNAARTHRFGCGRILPMRRVNAKRMTSALAALISDAHSAHHCDHLRRKIAPGPEAIAQAVDEIQTMWGRGRVLSTEH